jgi:peptidoglycan hydrolase CwlO-like protein
MGVAVVLGIIVVVYLTILMSKVMTNGKQYKEIKNNQKEILSRLDSLDSDIRRNTTKIRDDIDHFYDSVSSDAVTAISSEIREAIEAMKPEVETLMQSPKKKKR